MRRLLQSAPQYVRKLRSRVFVDLGRPQDTVLLAGMGRSGTTWVAQLLNCDQSDRILFEPFNSVHVRLAAPFEYIQYMDPGSRHRARTAAAERILAGRVRSSWVDVENGGFVFRRRIIKEIRANLMLRWLAAISPRTPIILIVRHPLAVAASWLQLGWGRPASDGESADFEVMMRQTDFLTAFPVLAELAQRIDHRDPLQRVIFQWCAFHLVPFRQFRDGELAIVWYEQLLVDPEQETEKLFRHAGRAYDWDRVSRALRQPSTTSKSGRTDRRWLLSSWQRFFDTNQIRTATSILRMAGLDALYTNDGEGVVALTPGQTPSFAG